MRVWVDQAGDHGAAARVDHLGRRRQRDLALSISRRPDKDDAAVESGDGGVRDWGDVVLRGADTRPGARARGDQVGVANQEVRLWQHCNINIP